MNDSRIVFDHAWKKFNRGETHDSLRDLIASGARRLVGRRPSADQLSDDDFWAVRDLSFEVLPGQALGIIGANGSGKSTALRMLTKILEPTRGHCEVRGRVGALIEISAGFHGDLTGRENVFLQGAIMGMRSADIARKFDEIVEFSGVSEFIDMPVKRYSSGMNARLGFAIAAHLDPDVLIIDEVLAVGDYLFQERAFGRLRNLARSGIPVVIVSHQLDRIADLCTDAIVLERGNVVARGSTTECIGAYVQRGNAPLPASEGGSPVTLRSLSVVGDATIASGGWCTVRIEGSVDADLKDEIEPVYIRFSSVAHSTAIFRTGSRRLGVRVPTRGAFSVEVRLQANVPAGTYTIGASVFDSVAQEDILRLPVAHVQVTETGSFLGSVQLNAQMCMADTMG